MMNDLDNVGGAYTDGNGAGALAGGKMGMLASVAVASGLGFVGGMLLGKKKGEARGLAVGMELGRTEAAAALATPRTWRRFWRREAAAQVE